MADTEIQNALAEKRSGNMLYRIGITVAVVLPVIITEILAYSSISYQDKLFYSRFIYWAIMGGVIWYSYQVEHQKPLLWRAEKSDPGFVIVSVIVLYFVCVGCGIISSIPTFLGFKESDAVIRRVASLMAGHTWLIIFVSFTAGVTEEFIFRGYILTRLSLMIKNQYAPIIVSAALFSALHYRYGSLKELLLAFTIGIAFGIYYQKYKNIIPLMIAHFLLDFISLELATHFMKK